MRSECRREQGENINNKQTKETRRRFENVGIRISPKYRLFQSIFTVLVSVGGPLSVCKYKTQCFEIQKRETFFYAKTMHATGFYKAPKASQCISTLIEK